MYINSAVEANQKHRFNHRKMERNCFKKKKRRPKIPEGHSKDVTHLSCYIEEKLKRYNFLSYRNSIVLVKCCLY